MSERGDWADDLCEAVRILRRYSREQPLVCADQVLHAAVDPDNVSAEDRARLEALGFEPDGFEGFGSTRFGLCHRDAGTP